VVHPSRTALKTIQNKNFYGLSSGSVGRGGEDLFKKVSFGFLSARCKAFLPRVRGKFLLEFKVSGYYISRRLEKTGFEERTEDPQAVALPF
jgi:hypothetical protein